MLIWQGFYYSCCMFSSLQSFHMSMELISCMYVISFVELLTVSCQEESLMF